MANLWLFILFILINTLVAIIYFLIGWFTKQDTRRLILFRSMVILLAPGVGVLFLCLSFVLYVLFFKREVDLSDVVFSKARAKEIVRTNEERERNMVSMEEAIEVTEKGELRNFMMGVAQSDYSESLAAIELALNCEDTETAHYAASVLQDALNDFRLIVQKDSKRILETPDDNSEERIEEIVKLLEYMNKIMAQHVFAEVEQKSFTDIMERLMDVFLQISPGSITSEMFENISLRLIDVKAYERCERWCLLAKEMHPNTLATYTALIKLYFNCGEKEKFFEELNALKQSNVIIDNKTLELIRAFI